MDEIELLVEQTYRHFQDQFSKEAESSDSASFGMRNNLNFIIPQGPGIIYHIQKSMGLFVLRTFISLNIRNDYVNILEEPGNYPALRLLEGSGQVDISSRLRFFSVQNSLHAEMIHDQINNRRFPIEEETLCNISDPGFSWWLSTKGKGFKISFNLAHSEYEGYIKLGPLGDQNVALKQFEHLSSILQQSGLDLEMQAEVNRFSLDEGEALIIEELRKLFEEGIISESLAHLFKLLARNYKDHTSLESTWFYLDELASMRKFWIQVQDDLFL